MKKNLREPCSACPFRKKSMPGYVGADEPASFIATAQGDCEMPCHMTVDYDDSDWKKKLAEVEHCAGAAIYFANQCKISRSPDRLSLAADRDNVFSFPAEFLEHHNRSGA